MNTQFEITDKPKVRHQADKYGDIFQALLDLPEGKSLKVAYNKALPIAFRYRLKGTGKRLVCRNLPDGTYMWLEKKVSA